MPVESIAFSIIKWLVYIFLGFLVLIPFIVIFFLKYKRVFKKYRTMVIIERVRDGATTFTFDWARQKSDTKGEKIRRASAWELYKAKHTVPLQNSYLLDARGRIILNLYSPEQGVYYHKKTVVGEKVINGKTIAISKVIPRNLLEEQKQELNNYFREIVYSTYGWGERNPMLMNFIVYGSIIMMVLTVMGIVVLPKLAAVSGTLSVQCVTSNIPITPDIISGI